MEEAEEGREVLFRWSALALHTPCELPVTHHLAMLGAAEMTSEAGNAGCSKARDNSPGSSSRLEALLARLFRCRCSRTTCAPCEDVSRRPKYTRLVEEEAPIASLVSKDVAAVAPGSLIFHVLNGIRNTQEWPGLHAALGA